MNLAYLGNFTAEHSTEQQIVRALRRLGHDVLTVDVRKAVAGRRAAIEAIRRTTPDVVFYTRSNGCPLPAAWTHAWLAFQEAGATTVGLHLDVFRGIGSRELLVQAPVEERDPQFTVEHLWTADGSDETARWFAAAGINHRWFPPGVDPDLAAWDRLPFPGTPPVVFVGSVSTYHAEHPGRAELVAAMRAAFGDDFGVFGPDTLTVRGPQLSRLLCSTRVVVGDCFDGGTRDRYWSDRLPETLARGVPLVHPAVVGLNHQPGLWRHRPGDYDAAVASVRRVLDSRPAPGTDDRIATAALTADSWDRRMADLLGHYADA